MKFIGLLFPQMVHLSNVRFVVIRQRLSVRMLLVHGRRYAVRIVQLTDFLMMH